MQLDMLTNAMTVPQGCNTDHLSADAIARADLNFISNIIDLGYVDVGFGVDGVQEFQLTDAGQNYLERRNSQTAVCDIFNQFGVAHYAQFFTSPDTIQKQTKQKTKN